MNIGSSFVAAGTFAILGALLEWGFFMSNRQASLTAFGVAALLGYVA